MAGAGHVFHVEFGINDTELTRALEAGRYNEAQKLIQDNAQTSYLDEGCYQRIPLYIVLCGLGQQGTSSIPRNLHIANQLVQYGANVNYRVPETEFGAEYLSPGKTGLELLVDLYTQLTLHPCHAPPSPAQDVDDLIVLSGPQSYFNFSRDIVIGLDGQIVSDQETLLEEICDIIFIMLGHGGDANIRDEYNMTLLHRAAVLSADDRLLKILCEGGADLNALDVRRNSPLSSLCDPFPFGIHHFMAEREIVYSADEDIEDGCNPHLDCCNLNGKEHFLEYLLSYKDVQLDVQNRPGRTALFNCIVRGDIRSATLLLQHGCDPTLRGRSLLPETDGEIDYRDVSPLFAALCSNRVVKYHYESAASCRQQPNYQFLAPLVDAGFFSNSEIVSELHEHVQEDDTLTLTSRQQLRDLGSQAIHLMFGSTTSTLRQLSARKVFTTCGLDKPGRSNCDTVLPSLNLPKDTFVCFQVELFRENLCRKFRQMRWFRMEGRSEDALDGIWGAGGSSDSDSDNSNGGDSDLEYW